MVNKAVVGVVGIILITTLGVGALVGLQGGGEVPAENPTDTPEDGSPTEQTPGENATATPNGTAVGTEVPGEERTAIPGRRFAESDVESNLTESLEEWRRDEGLDPVDTTGNTARQLAEMAGEHSVAMADEGYLTHEIDGVGVGDRYSDVLDNQCAFVPAGAGYNAEPGGPNFQFEWLADGVAGDTYTVGNETRFDANERAVADALLEDLQARMDAGEGVLEPEVTKLGVGAEVTRDGAVYATVHLCGG